MCGRSACARGGAQIRQSVNAAQFLDESRYRPSYNVGPNRFQPVLTRDAETGERVLRAMRWGLIPFWTKKEPDFGAIVKAINARDDSLTSNKPMFNHIKKARRCVVVADGFYEWLKDSNPRQPYFVQFQGGKILTMAGLYDVWTNAEGEQVYSYTIVTTDSSSKLSFLHDRMPLILEGDDDIDLWLDVSVPFEDAKSLIRPYEGKLDIFPVSTFVNKIGNDSEECIKPVTKKLEAQKITNFFKKNAEKVEAKKRTAEEVEQEDREQEAEQAQSHGKDSQGEKQKEKEKEKEKEMPVVQPQPKRIKLSELKPAAASEDPKPAQPEKTASQKNSQPQTNDDDDDPPTDDEHEDLKAKIDSIVLLGFTRKVAESALAKYNGDLEAACQALIEEADV